MPLIESNYITPIAQLLADPRFASLRIVTVVEPDSLPNMVTNNTSAYPACEAVAQANEYELGVQYAIKSLHPLSNVYIYLDIAHSGWLGWTSNSTPAAQYFAQVVSGVAGGDMKVIDGFISNTANYTPTVEPFLPNSTLQIGGNPIDSGAFYQWNPIFDESHYVTTMKTLLVQQGFPQSIGF